jgi:E3 ubiquitin-protein ligase UHRF1
LLAGLGLEVPAAKRRPVPRPKKIYPGSTASGDTSNRRKSARVAKVQDGIYREARDEYDDDDEYSDEEGSMSDLYSDSSEDEGRSRKRKRGQGWPRYYEGETLVGDAKGLRRRVVNGRNVQHIDPRKRMARADPKVHGSIPGIDVGHWWPSRMACSADSVHPVCSHSLFCLSQELLLMGGFIAYRWRDIWKWR